jgi:hypothetical protein
MSSLLLVNLNPLEQQLQETSAQYHDGTKDRNFAFSLVIQVAESIVKMIIDAKLEQILKDKDLGFGWELHRVHRESAWRLCKIHKDCAYGRIPFSPKQPNLRLTVDFTEALANGFIEGIIKILDKENQRFGVRRIRAARAKASLLELQEKTKNQSQQ